MDIQTITRELELNITCSNEEEILKRIRDSIYNTQEEFFLVHENLNEAIFSDRDLSDLILKATSESKKVVILSGRNIITNKQNHLPENHILNLIPKMEFNESLYRNLCFFSLEKNVRFNFFGNDSANVVFESPLSDSKIQTTFSHEQYLVDVMHRMFCRLIRTQAVSSVDHTTRSVLELLPDVELKDSILDQWNLLIEKYPDKFDSHLDIKFGQYFCCTKEQCNLFRDNYGRVSSTSLDSFFLFIQECIKYCKPVVQDNDFENQWQLYQNNLGQINLDVKEQISRQNLKKPVFIMVHDGRLLGLKGSLESTYEDPKLRGKCVIREPYL